MLFLSLLLPSTPTHAQHRGSPPPSTIGPPRRPLLRRRRRLGAGLVREPLTTLRDCIRPACLAAGPGTGTRSHARLRRLCALVDHPASSLFLGGGSLSDVGCLRAEASTSAREMYLSITARAAMHRPGTASCRPGADSAHVHVHVLVHVLVLAAARYRASLCCACWLHPYSRAQAERVGWSCGTALCCFHPLPKQRFVSRAGKRIAANHPAPVHQCASSQRRPCPLCASRLAGCNSAARWARL